MAFIDREISLSFSNVRRKVRGWLLISFENSETSIKIPLFEKFDLYNGAHKVLTK